MEQRTSLWALAAIFLASRSAAYVAGVRFDASDWTTFWHFVDPVLLHDRLGESLLYLHAQPPLFNALLGVVLKVAPQSLPAIFGLGYWACGWVIAWQLHALIHRLGSSPGWALLGAGLFAVAPATLLYENYLFYTYPLVALILVATNVFVRATTAGNERDWWLLAGVVTVMALTRTLFHPLWMVSLAVIAWFSARAGVANRRVALLAMAGAVLVVVVAVAGKNYVLFDRFTMSTWRGMNVARVAFGRLEEQQRLRWVREGILSPVAQVGPFEPLDAYDGLIDVNSHTGIALLDQREKSTGAVNFHHLAYVAIARSLERDAWTVLHEAPGAYLRSVAGNLKHSFEPATSYRPLARNRSALSSLDAGLDEVFGPRLGGTSGPRWIALLYGLVFVHGCVAARRASGTQRYVFVWLTFNMAWVIGIGALLERGENQRFRFLVEPLAIALGMHALARYAPRVLRTLRTR